MINPVFKDRESTTRFNILGAASKLEDASKKIGVAARCLREYMQTYSGDDLFTQIGTRNFEISAHIDAIRKEMNGLEPLFDFLAGAKRPS